MYNIDVQTDAVCRRMADTESVSRRRVLMPEDSRHISRTLGATTPPPIGELVRRHRSRMSRSTQASSPSS